MEELPDSSTSSNDSALKDSRTGICLHLALLADAQGVPITDRKWIHAKLYELAKQDQMLPADQQKGFAKAVAKYTTKGITQIINKAIGMRKIEVPEYLRDADPITVTQQVAIQSNSVKASVKPVAVVINTNEVELVYSLRLSSEYSPDRVATTLVGFLRSSIKAPFEVRSFEVAKAGDRYDLKLSHTCRSSVILDLLKQVTWVVDAVTKPVSLYGSQVIAAE